MAPPEIEDLENLAYVIGLALGDGNLSNPNGRATRLRITCDTKYPLLIKNITQAIQKLLPSNKVSVVKMKGNCVYVSCYSNKWESWLGWYSGKGSKFIQKARVPDWIKNDPAFTKNCLKGLFETDGSVYYDRGYRIAMFVTTIPLLAEDVAAMTQALGFNPRTYKITLSPPLLTRFNIRISKNAPKFIDTVGINKY